MVALEMRGLFYRQFPSVTSDVSLARVARVSFRDDSRTTVNWVQPFANNLPSWISRVSLGAKRRSITTPAHLSHAPDPHAYGATARHLVETLWEFLEARNTPH